MRMHILFLFVSLTQLSYAQDGWGGHDNFHTKKHECISSEERALVSKIIHDNIKYLEAQGRIKPPSKNLPIFDWPLRRTDGFNQHNYYVISNYVDHNNTELLQDYNCGQRTYNGHRGTDISIQPFTWLLKNNSSVEVVAAAAGNIVRLKDGEFDEECRLDENKSANSVILRHEDGSLSYYWHLKEGSVVNKEIGDYVERGEYLGIVASSGYSTGPHLHFEVRDADENVIDPYVGACNDTSGESLWKEQQEYRQHKILELYTGDDVPQANDCPPDRPNQKTFFYPGETIFFTQFHKDLLVGAERYMTITRPNGTVWESWNQSYDQSTADGHYTLFWWYNSRSLPSNAPAGTWTFEVETLDEKHLQYFEVLPIGDNPVVNDDCIDAIHLEVGENCNISYYDNYLATESIIEPDYICGTEGERPLKDVWFQCDAPMSGELIIETIESGDPDQMRDVIIQVYAGPCNKLSILDCNDDKENEDFHSRILLEDYPPGEILYIRLIGKFGEQGTFGICANQGIMTSAEDPISHTIEVFPNPSQDIITINSGNNAQYITTLFSTNGSVIIEPSERNTINVQGLDAGIYFLKIEDKFNQVTFVEKVIIK